MRYSSSSILLSVSILSFVGAAPVRAQDLNLSSETQDVYVGFGEYGTQVCYTTTTSPGWACWPVIWQDYVATCHRRVSSSTAVVTTIPAANTTSSPNAMIHVALGSGNDRLAEIDVAHQCTGPTSGPGTRTWIRPLQSDLDIGVFAEGGPGQDVLVGTAWRDRLVSNEEVYAGGFSFAYPSDGATDYMCSRGGDDDIYGDDQSSGGHDYLAGGAGDDLCDGGLNSSTDYARSSCETVVHATTTLSSTDWSSCSFSISSLL